MNGHTHVALASDPPTASDGMPHCKDCRWWERKSEDEGLCALIDIYGHEDTPAWIVGSGELLTRPDFGCVQFQPRESEPL